MSTQQLTFSIQPVIPFRDILIAELVELGFDGFEELEHGLIAYRSPSDEPFDLLQLQVAQLSEVQIQVEQASLEEVNWNSAWESQFQPIQISADCTIRAPFHHGVEGGRWDVVIEPKMSFGTGHHATTFLMCQALLNAPPASQIVLDMGCGTGVLAILARLLGALEVDAIDIDPWSYENTIENVQRNQVQNICTIQGGAEAIPDKKYDLILANINRNILLADMDKYVSKLNRGGGLWLSGFFSSDVEALNQLAQSLGLNKSSEKQRGEWCLLQYNKA
ncbi:MAG: 50S ribosomal protein L11 methyltransferase [Flavobacteriales bacterium]